MNNRRQRSSNRARRSQTTFPTLSGTAAATWVASNQYQSPLARAGAMLLVGLLGSAVFEDIGGKRSRLAFARAYGEGLCGTG